MQPVELVTELRKIFSNAKAQRVIPIIRRDHLLWNALLDDLYYQKMVAFAGDEPERWSPAGMALVAIVDRAQAGQTIKDLILQAHKKSEDAARIFEETRQVVRQPKNLVEAGNLALAMYQRFTNNDGSRSLLQEIMPLPGEAERPALLIWQTPLAILTGMADDPLEVLRSLMPKRISPLVEQWVCNAVFSNPFEAEKKVEIFSALFTGLPPAQQLSWLRQIHLTEDRALVVEIARRLLTKTSISSAQLLSKTNLDMVDVETAIVRCLELQRLAGLYRFANQPANARVMLQKAQSIVQHWLAGLGVQDADLSALEGQEVASLAALQNALTLGGGSNGMQTEILLSVAQPQQAESLVEQLSEQTTNPISQIFLASRIAKTGEVEFARDMANRAVELWLQQVNRQPLPFSSQFAMEWHPLSLVQTLVDLQLPQQAISVAKKVIEIRPVDASMSMLISKIFDQVGDTRQALVHAQFAAAITPEDSSVHAWLSILWGKMGKWGPSFQEQHQAIFLQQNPTAEDWSLLARCAVMLKDWTRVEEACDQALAVNPDHGSSLAMKGQAYLETGRLEEAGKMLSRATLLAPEEAGAWMQLARLYDRTNNHQRAVETLRAAVLAVPSSADINFALARSYLNNGLTSEALPFLRKAATLDQDSIDIAVDLGETLTVLGHTEEAVQLMEQARTKWPQHPRLAYTHAQAALSLGQRDTALKALEVAIDTDQPEFDWYLLFARTILGKDLYQLPDQNKNFAWVVKAEQALIKALSLRPDHYEAQLLLAEVVQRKGNYEEAYALFEALIDRPEFHSVEYRWRVQAGLGQVSMNLKHYDSALASLQEAVADQPENVYLQHLVAEAYILSQLEKEALATARYALKLAPDDIENLTWFADIMTRLGEPLEAVQALRTATQLAPDTPGHWLKLAELYLVMEDHEAAKANLNKLLSLRRLDADLLHKAAFAFLQMKDFPSVLNCLNLVTEANGGVDLEIAYYAILANDLEVGLKAIQDAAQQNPEETALYVVEADLLNGLNRLDAALACLEHALHLNDNRNQAEDADEEWWGEVKDRGLVPVAWLQSIRTTEAIHDHLARLFRQMGDFNSALHHSNQALELNPDNHELRLQAAEICEALMLFDRQEKILADVKPLENDQIESSQSIDPGCLAQLISMKAEKALEAGRQEDALHLAEQAERIEANQSRLISLQARLAARNGEWMKAVELLDQASQSPGVWYAKAALELFQWDAGLRCLELLANRQPADLYAQYWLARGLATAALQRKTGMILGLAHRLPGEHVLSEKAQAQFERAALAASKSILREAGYWQAIGKAIYHPGLQTIRELAAILPGESQAAALVAVLREITNLPGAIQVAEQYQDSPDVLFQLALCYLSQDSGHGLDAARRAADLRPNLPMMQALYARLCQDTGSFQEALNALEIALQMWPDEPDWHVWAGDLAEMLGEGELVMEHWDQALQLKPQYLDYAVPAGRAYLRHHQAQKAIKVLQAASDQDPDLPEIWYLLGKALSQAGQNKLALASAEKACQLEPRTVEPALLCGEIALKLGHADEALHWAQKAVSLNNQDPEAILFLSKIYTQRKNQVEALNILENAIQHNVSSKDLLLHRAWLIYQLSGVEAALPVLKSLNTMYPNEASILQLLAQVEMESGDLTAAEQISAQALQLEPEQPELNLLMGKLQRLAGQLDQSIHYLSETIHQEPGRPEAYLELGQVYLDRREPDQALQVFQKAMKTVPQDYRSFYQSGLILREGKDYQGAEAMLRRAAELAPDDLNIRRQLGAVITLNLIHSSQEASSSNESQRAQR